MGPPSREVLAKLGESVLSCVVGLGGWLFSHPGGAENETSRSGGFMSERCWIVFRERL